MKSNLFFFGLILSLSGYTQVFSQEVRFIFPYDYKRPHQEPSQYQELTILGDDFEDSLLYKLKDFNNIQKVWFSGMQKVHRFPDTLIHSPFLRKIHFSRCTKIDYDSIFTKILFLNQLQELDIYEAELRYIPKAIASFSTLEYLALNYNYLLGIDTFIFELKNLHHLEVYHNDLQAIPPQIAKLPNLDYFSVSANPVFYRLRQAEISTVISYFKTTHIKRLHLAQTSLRFFPNNLNTLDALEFVNLGDNPIKRVKKQYFDRPVVIVIMNEYIKQNRKIYRKFGKGSPG